MFITFTYKGKYYTLPLIEDTRITYDCLAVIQYQDDTRPRLQLASRGYTHESRIRLATLSSYTTPYFFGFGQVILSKSMKRAWLDRGYCHALKNFVISQELS